MDLQADTVSGSMRKFTAHPGAGDVLSDNAVKFPAGNLILESGKADLLSPVDGFVCLSDFFLRFLEKEGAGLIAVVALKTGPEIYGNDVTVVDQAIGGDAVWQG